MARFDCGEGRSVYYEHYRGIGTPVVLIHGWAMSSRIWAGTIEALMAAGHEVIAVDLRGCGQSNRDFADLSLAALAGDVVGIVGGATDRPVVLNGWSLGGAVAAEAARLLGAQTAGLVLTCGASPRFTRTDDFPYGGTAEGLDSTAAALAADRAGFFRALAGMVCAREVSPATVDWMWAAFIDSGPGVIRSLLDLADLDQRPLLRELEAPVLSIVGSADAVLESQVGIEAAKLARHGTVAVFDGCGHAPFIEDAPAYMAALQQFLTGL